MTFLKLILFPKNDQNYFSQSVLKYLPQASRFTAALFVGCSLYTSASYAQLNSCAATPGSCWLSPGGDENGNDTGIRYYPNTSALGNISNTNAALTQEFQYATNILHSHQGSPLVVRTGSGASLKVTMYIVTPFPNKLIALDVTNPGPNPSPLWTFSPNPGSYAEGLTCCDTVNRGPAYAEATVRNTKTKTNETVGLIVYTLLDGNVVAVNAKTGQQVWRTKVADPWKGETLNTAPIVVKGKKLDGSYSGTDKVIFGSSGSEMGIRGSVRALNLATGALIWQAYSTGPDSEVKITKSNSFYPKDKVSPNADQGVTSWGGPTTYQNGGGSVWTWVTYDPETHTIFYGTSQPGTFNPDMRSGDNKWASTIFARDPDTGEGKWQYQTQPHDNWDYDAMNENTVLNLRINDQDRKVIVHLHKNGFAYVMDRKTGEIIQAPHFGYENWSGGSVNTTDGLPVSYDASAHNYTNYGILADKKTAENSLTTNICPSAFGVKNWGYSTYSKNTGYLYFGAFNVCQNYRPTKVNYIAGTPFVGAEIGLSPNFGGTAYNGPKNTTNGSTTSSDPILGSALLNSIGTNDNFMMGEFVAFDPVSGERKWTIREPKVVVGGALSTAGDVVFYGTGDGRFRAVNATNGALLAEKQLGCGIVSAPIAYIAGDGKPRVAITTGLGWLNSAFAGQAKCTGKVHVFKVGS
ncbi:MAG: PQQ-binding-like beta-propeller repeat protein [Hyphomicrobium sp.]